MMSFDLHIFPTTGILCNWCPKLPCLTGDVGIDILVVPLRFLTVDPPGSPG